LASRSPLSVASFVGSVRAEIATDAVDDAAMIEGAAASASMRSNLVTLKRLSLDRNKTAQGYGHPNLGFPHPVS